jgi:hypothetical protein
MAHAATTSTSSPAAITGRSTSALPTIFALASDSIAQGEARSSKKYGVFRLVHVEVFATPLEAIARKKLLKSWKRDWKIKLIEKENPDWNDRCGLIQQLG